MERSDHHIVILVLANKPAALRGLLCLLDERFRIIIHLDAKIDATDIELPPHASFTAVRLPIFWGGFNMVLAIREMLDAAYRLTPSFHRAVLISSDALPLLPPERLEAALLDDKREHIHLIHVPDDPALRGLSLEECQIGGAGRDLSWRFQNFTYLDDEILSPRSRAEFTVKYGVTEGTGDYLRGTAERIVLKTMSHLSPRLPLYSNFYYGETWWALSRFAVDLIMDDIHSKIHSDYFQFMRSPEEHFIPTILGNKRQALASADHTAVGSPMFVDHADPVRADFGRDALSAVKFRHAALSGRYLFARKYDPELMPDVAAAVAAGCFFSDIVGT